MTLDEAKLIQKLDGRLPSALQSSLQPLVMQAHRVVRLVKVDMEVMDAQRNVMSETMDPHARRLLTTDFPTLSERQRETINLALVARLAAACGHLFDWTGLTGLKPAAMKKAA